MSIPSHKKQIVKYNFSGLETDVCKVLRSFSADSVLKKINREATKIFQSDSQAKGIEYITLPMVNAATKIQSRHTFIIQAWGLIDLAYYEILYSNDYRNRNIESDDDLYLLAVAVDNLRARHESEKLSEWQASQTKLMYYLYGFGGEQFKHQAIGTVFDTLYRELHVLLDIGSTIPDGLKISSLFQEIAGMSWQSMIAIQQFLWFAFQKYDTLSDVLDHTFFRSDEIKKRVEDVANKYSASYEDIRKSELKRQIFYSKPFVKTGRNEIVSISPFLNLSILEQSVQWTIRDGLRDRGYHAEVFTSFFGKCFEVYFQQLLSDCLSPGEYRRIDEEREKRADWEICIGSTKIIVEQKSALLFLSAKQQESDIVSIEKYARNTLLKAVNQLKITEESLNNGKYIKIILLYETYLKDEMIDYFFDSLDCPFENDNYYWMVTISEMERLLYLQKSNPQLFMSIITEKINREINHSTDGKSIEQLLDMNGCGENDYLNGRKFQKYQELIRNEIISMMQ